MIPYCKVETDKLDLSSATKQAEMEYFGFSIDVLDIEKVLESNPFLKWLYEKHPFRAGLLNLEPFKTYKWHTDGRRGVSINALISDSPSVTLFSENVFQEDSHQADIQQLDYELNQIYLFNPQVPHTVINFDKPRLLFSCEFFLNKDELSFDQLKTIVNENYTLSL